MSSIYKILYLQTRRNMLALIAILLMQVAQGQQNPTYRELNIAQGLSDNEVHAICQDDWGFLWIGTQNGLNRFNGLTFSKFNTSNSSLLSNEVRDIVSTGANQLAIATGNGIVLLDTRTEEMKSHFIHDNTALYTFKNSFDKLIPLNEKYLAAVSKNGMYIFDPGLNLIACKESGFTADDAGLKRIYFVLNADKFSNGDLLIATTKGYYLYRFKDREFISLETCQLPEYLLLKSLIQNHSSSYIFNINKQDHLFFLDNKNISFDSLYIFKKKSNEINTLPLPFNPKSDIRWDGKFQFHKNGTTTITCSLNGYFEFMINNEATKWISPPIRKAEHANCRDVFQLSDNSYLIGTESGLYISDNERSNIKYTPIRSNIPGINENLIYSIFSDSSHTFVAPFAKRGTILVQHKKTGTVKEIITDLGGKRSLVFDMISWNGDTLLLGTEQGLSLFNKKTHEIIDFGTAYTTPHTMKGAVSAMFKDNQKNLWVSFTTGGGIWRFDPVISSAVFFPSGNKINQLPLRYCNTITQDKAGNIWMLHYSDGIARFNTRKNIFDTVFRKLPLPKSPAQSFAGLTGSNAGGIWIYVNTYGLVYLNPEQGILRTEIQMNERAETGSNPLAITDSGILCINLRNSISLYKTALHQLIRIDNPQKNTAFTNKLKRPVFDEFSKSVMSAYSNTLLTWHYTTDFKKTNRRKLFITRVLSVDDKQVKNRFENLEFSYRQNDLTISFGVPDFDAVVPLQYEYKIVKNNSEEQWVSLGTQQFINLNNLAPGSYTFSIRYIASIPDEAGVTDGFTFIIKPPFYITWWFRALMVALIFTIIYFLYRLRMIHIRKINSLRTGISADLHDEIGSRLTNLRFMNLLVQKDLSQDAGKDYLEKMDEEIVASGEALNQIVWNLKDQPASLEDFYALVRNYASEIFEQDDIKFMMHTNARLNDRNLNNEQYRDMVLITKELINNIRKHAAATEVQIEMSTSMNRLIIIAKDNGRGFDPGAKSYRNGLPLLRKRLAKWNGKLTVESQIDKGTTVTAALKLHYTSPIRSIFFNRRSS